MAKQVQIDCNSGEITVIEVEDIIDDLPVQATLPTQEERIAALEAALLELLMGG